MSRGVSDRTRIERSGLASWIGSHLALAESWPVWLLILAMAATIV
jgi:hypothetical protein